MRPTTINRSSSALVKSSNGTFNSSSSNRFSLSLPRLHSNSSKDGSSSIEDFRKKQEQLEEEFNKNSPIIPPHVHEATNNSTESPKDEKTQKIRRDILNAAIKHVPTLGWTKEAICKGAEDLGYPGVVHGMFPRGSAELIEYFYTNCTERLVEWMDKETEGGTKVGSGKEFVTRAVQQRLMMLEPYLNNWPKAIAVMSLPPNAIQSLANLLTLADEICYFSGDRAVDVSRRGVF